MALININLELYLASPEQITQIGAALDGFMSFVYADERDGRHYVEYDLDREVESVAAGIASICDFLEANPALLQEASRINLSVGVRESAPGTKRIEVSPETMRRLSRVSASLEYCIYR